MHYFLAFLAVVGGLAFWWWRIRMAGQAANEVIDAAQTMKGLYQRRKFLKGATGSAITAIDDPALAAATVMTAIAAARGPLSPRAEAFIAEKVRVVMGLADPTETITYARWAAEQSPDPNNAIAKLAPLMHARLSAAERADVLAMSTEAAAIDGEPDPIQADALKRLARALA